MSKNTQLMNLLDLPVEILEEIFLYCVGSGSLLKLTETNSYFKNVIEFSSSLMQHIRLNVNTNRGKSIEPQILEAIVRSTRRYKSIKLDLSTDSYGSNLLDDNSGLLLKQLFDINAESLKDVEIVLSCVKYEDFWSTLKLLENLLNVEKIVLIVEIEHSTFENNAPSSSYPSYKFNKLKHLVLDFEDDAALSALLNVFEECHMIINLRETLKSFDIDMNYGSQGFDNAKMNVKFAELLIALKNFNLNLKVLHLDSFLQYLNYDNVERLKEFVMSQRNLETFKLDCRINQLLLNNIKDLLAGDLKVLQIVCWGFEENTDETLYQPWNLNKLEVFQLECDLDEEEPNFVHKIFHSPSDLLKKIELNCINLGSNALTNIIRNYRNLTELSLIRCINHKSDDLFAIFKILKKLKTLSFHFPDESELNENFFVNSEDLVLSDLRQVHLDFNNSIDNYHVINLMQLLKSTSNFSFNIRNWKNYNNDTLYIITRELPNLKEFLDKYSKDKIETSTLKRIKNNIQQFNKNPHLFRICGKNIDVWIEELSQRQQ